jgi:hypothetical protein
MAGHKSVALRLLRRTPQSLQRVLTRLHFLVAQKRRATQAIESLSRPRSWRPTGVRAGGAFGSIVSFEQAVSIQSAQCETAVHGGLR